MKPKHGVFTVSLDFEMYWGVRDKRKIEQYKHNLLGIRKAIPEMLRLFSLNDIHATWATVGLLFFKDIEELNQNIPKQLPSYHLDILSPYKYIEETSELDVEYHFAPDVIDMIASNDGQEIGTHTFSHYYCFEKGQSISEFEEDISSALEIAKRKGFSIKCLIFPRHQWDSQHLSVLNKLGILCFRGNQSSWVYRASEEENKSKLQKAFHLLDAYFKISGHNTHALEDCLREKPFNFPASLFLRPYSRKLALLDGLRLRRIKNAMKDAAVNKRIFHLWWHPHNFGRNTDININFLGEIVKFYNNLKRNYGMVSMNMGELCQLPGVSNG